MGTGMKYDRTAKYDDDKLRMELLPPEVLIALSAVMTHGAEKYEDEGWKNVERERYIGALYRHLTKIQLGEVMDPDSGLPHWWAVLANVSFLCYFDTANLARDYEGLLSHSMDLARKAKEKRRERSSSQEDQ